MLYLVQTHWQTMFNEVSKLDKEEACGLVAGMNQTSRAVYPVTNILHSPVRYRMDPEQQLAVFNQIEKKGWELLAIYHSHLGPLPGPSSADVAEAAYPGVVHLIWFPSNREWVCRGYLIEKGSVTDVTLQIIDPD